jgi:hypothetical protein
MKKIIITFSFIFVSMFFQSGPSYAVTVADLYPAAAVIDAVTGSVSVPALLSVAGVGAMVSQAADVVLSSTTVAVMGAAIATAGIVYGGAAMYDYFNNSINSPYSVSNGKLIYTTAVSSGSPIPCALLSSQGTYHRSSDCPAVMAGIGGGCAGGGMVHTTTCSTGESVAFRFCQRVTDWHYCAGLPEITYNTVAPATAAQVASSFLADIAAHEAKAITAAMDVVTQAATIFPYHKPASGAAPLTSAPVAVKTAVINGLNASLTTEQIAAANAATLLNNADVTAANAIIAANNKLLSDQAKAANVATSAAVVYTSDEIAAAVDAATPAGVLLTLSQKAAVQEAVLSAQLNASSPLTIAQLSVAVSAGITSVVTGYTPQSTLDATVATAVAGTVPGYVKPSDISAAIAAAAAAKGLTLTPVQIAAAQAAVAGTISKEGVSTPARIAAAAAVAVVAAVVPLATVADVTNATVSALALPQVAAGNTLTAAQVQAAITAAIVPLAGYSSPTAPLPFAIPTVGDFSGLFRNFMDTMKGSSLFSLPGLLSSSVPTGGACSWSVDLGARFGGSQTFSICNWATGLSGIKAVLLCIASISAIGIIAKGGGA